MTRRPIYLDAQATTPVDPRVLEAMLPYFTEHFGNAASRSHAFGWRAEEAVDAARERIAAGLGVLPREIVFTSGATESNNLAILGLAVAAGEKRHVVTVATEHRAVLDPCAELSRRGFEITVLPVEPDGSLPPERIREALHEETLLVSLMAANNEIGSLADLDAIGAICRERGVLFHTDAAQAAGKVPLSLGNVDLASFSAHKIYGPKGVGGLFVRSKPNVPLRPILFGGGHERGLRSGTLNVPGIVGFAKALEIALAEREAEAERLSVLRERLRGRITSAIPDVRVNGHPTNRLPGNLSLSFPDVLGAALLMALRPLAVSSGSACTSAEPRPSHVLSAIGLPEPLAEATIRFGLGRGTTESEVDEAAEITISAVLRLREDRPR